MVEFCLEMCLRNSLAHNVACCFCVFHKTALAICRYVYTKAAGNPTLTSLIRHVTPKLCSAHTHELCEHKLDSEVFHNETRMSV